MLQVRTVWTGFTGAPGYTNLHFDAFSDVDDVLDAVTDFWTGLQSVFSTSTVLSIDNAVQVMDPTTGDVSAVLNGTSFHPPVTGSGEATIGPSPAGACITWETATVLNGRRVRGRTFLVPLSANAFEGNGTLATTQFIAINAAAAALVTNTAAGFGVWHRTNITNPGSFERATAAACRDKSAVLRSRRD